MPTGSMRIVQLSSRHGFYGGEVHLRDLAAALRNRGRDVLGAVRPGADLAWRLAEAGVPVASLPLADRCGPRGVLALRRLLEAWRPDILHVHCPRDYYLAALASPGTGVRLVATRHQLRPLSWARVKRPLLARLDAVIAVSDAVRDGLLASGLDPRRLVVIPNGVAAATDAPVDVAPLRRDLGLDPDAGPVVGMVGRLCPAKDPLTLLRALDLLRGRWPGLRAVLVGGGVESRYGRRLAALVAEGRLPVVICGYRPDAARLLPALDVLAVPSVAEPFGLVTVEAMMRGVPVVATASGGSREIVRDGRDGLLVRPGDPEALAVAIDRLLTDGGLRRRCVASAKARAAAVFGLERQVAATDAVYAAVLSRRPLPAPPQIEQAAAEA